MTGWLIAFAILIALAMFPLGLGVRYDAEGLLVHAKVGFLRFTVYPTKKKKTKSSKDKQEKKKESPAIGEKHKGGVARKIWPLAKLVLELLGDFRRKIRVKDLDLKVVLAGGDPCDLAMNYGKAWAAVGNLVPLLEHALIMKKRNIEVDCDFTAEETTVLAKVDLSITLGRLLALIARYGIRGAQILSTIQNTKKGGASK